MFWKTSHITTYFERERERKPKLTGGDHRLDQVFVRPRGFLQKHEMTKNLGSGFVYGQVGVEEKGEARERNRYRDVIPFLTKSV